MATALKSKSFQRNLLLSIGGVFLLFAICFSVYQYKREKEYKIDILHSRLQMYNYEMVQTVGKDSMSCSRRFRDYVVHHQMEGLRVSVIDKEGRVIFDSYDTDVEALGNHLQRTDVAIHSRNLLLFCHAFRRRDSACCRTIFCRADALITGRQYLYLLFRRSHPVAGHRSLLYHASHQPTYWLSARICREGRGR